MTSHTLYLRDMAGNPLGFCMPKGPMSDAQHERLVSLIADQFCARPSEVHFDEGSDENDEGLEYLTVAGKRVAYLDEGDGRGPSFVTLLEAAE